MSGVVTSLQNQTVKMAAALKQRKYRDQSGLFTAEGIRLVETAVASQWQLEVCLFTEQAVENERIGNIIGVLRNRGCRLLPVSQAIFNKISDTEQPQGIMLIVRKKTSTLDMVIASASPLIAVLDGLQEPGNVGALIRTAEAAGAAYVITTKGCADVYAAKTVRASMGSLFHIPVVEGVDQQDLAVYLRQQGIQLVVTDLDGAALYHQTDLQQATAIVFGNEGNGVSKALLDCADCRVYIPILGKAESLNVAAAAAVILYEAVRQRS